MITSNLDSDWWFRPGDGVELANVFLKRPADVPFDGSGWRQVDLPHDWSIECTRSPDAPCGSDGGYFPEGVAWYRKHWNLPAAWKGKRFFIEFEGIYKNAEVILNGRFLGRHAYGYTSFIMDATSLMEPGTENTLLVRVDNSCAGHSRWYSGSGIYRHVWLHVAGPIYIPRWGVAVTTPVVGETVAVIEIATEVCNTSDKDRLVDICWTSESPDGLSSVCGEQSLNLARGAQVTACCTLKIERPERWSPDTPKLYTLHAMVYERGGQIDLQSLSFGIRTFHFSASEGFVLNGCPLLLRGGCVHHDHGPLGAVSLDRAEERKVELLKANGYNAVRCAHNPPAPAFLDACDRLGLLVIDEAFDVWCAGKRPYDYHCDFDACWESDLSAMILRDRNHPSVILWSIGNELFERHQPEGELLARMLTDRVHALDPSRPVTAGICHAWNGVPWEAMDGILAPLDVGGYNYLAHLYESDHERFPERVMIATESYPREQFDYWKAVERLPYVAGDFVWAAIDYLGEAGVGNARADNEPERQFMKWPWHQANCGDLDVCGFKRPQSWYRDVLWGRAAAPKLFVHRPLPPGRSWVINLWGWDEVMESWTWPGMEGKSMKIDVYADCAAVELYVNGRKVGEAPATEAQRYRVSFEVPYEPGEIKAVARRWAGGEDAVTELRTAGAPAILRLTPDRDRLRANRNDLSYVTVEVCDASGVVVPCADSMVDFAVDGPARLAAVGTADPCNTESYRGLSHGVWRGRALAVIQPLGTPGKAVLNASAAGLVGALAGFMIGPNGELP